MLRRRIFWIALGLLLFGILAAACAPPGGAKKEASGELNLLCTPQVEWCEGMKAEFEKKYPNITVNFVRMSSGESLTRLRNEKDNPQFDIWWGGPVDGQIAAKQEGLLEKYETPAQDKIINKKLMLDPDRYWVGVYVGSLGFATNKDWSEANDGWAPKSWDDLLDPRLKGQLMVAHPSSSGTSYTALCTILQVKGEDAGWEYLKKYAEQVNQFTKSGSAPARFVGAGEAAVGIVFSHDIVKQIEDGMPLILSFPEEGTGYEIGGMGIIKGAKNLENAKLWYDWALQPETQELGPKYGAYQAPTVEGAKASKPELLKVKLIDYDFEWCGQHKKEFVDRFTNEIAGAENLKK